MTSSLANMQIRVEVAANDGGPSKKILLVNHHLLLNFKKFKMGIQNSKWWLTNNYFLNNGWSTTPKINDGQPYLILDCSCFTEHVV